MNFRIEFLCDNGVADGCIEPHSTTSITTTTVAVPTTPPTSPTTTRPGGAQSHDKKEIAIDDIDKDSDNNNEPWLILGMFSVTGSNIFDIIIFALVCLLIGIWIAKKSNKSVT